MGRQQGYPVKHLILFTLAVFIGFPSTKGDDTSSTTHFGQYIMPKSNLVDLNYTNFDAFTSSGTWIVEFYAPWCGHCRRFAPEYSKAAGELKGLAYFGKVDGSKDRGLMARFGVNAFPTLFHLKDGEIRQYGAAHNKDGLENFLRYMWKDIPPLEGLNAPNGLLNRLKGESINGITAIINLPTEWGAMLGIPSIVVGFMMLLIVLTTVAFALIGLAVYLGDGSEGNARRRPHQD